MYLPHQSQNRINHHHYLSPIPFIRPGRHRPRQMLIRTKLFCTQVGLCKLAPQTAQLFCHSCSTGSVSLGSALREVQTMSNHACSAGHPAFYTTCSTGFGSLYKVCSENCIVVGCWTVRHTRFGIFRGATWKCANHDVNARTSGCS